MDNTPMYQQPQPQPQSQLEVPMTIGDWIVTMILVAIPCVGLIMLLIWAFGSNTPESKKNYARATLILMVIGVVLTVVFGAALGASLASIFSSMAY